MHIPCAFKNISVLLQIVQPEMLHDHEVGKSEASWLTTYKNVLTAKIHKEHNQLDDLTETEAKNTDEVKNLTLNKTPQYS